jgi:predicted Zn-dependent protease
VRGSTQDQLVSAQQPDTLWKFKEISWGKFSDQVIKDTHHKISMKRDLWRSTASESCQKFKRLRKQCPTPSHLLKSFARHCFSQEGDLIDAYREGLLDTQEWSDERESALGLIALRSGEHQRAFERCASVARHHPSMVASKCAGIAAERLGTWREAALYLRAYLASHPRDVPVHSALARILGKQGSDRDAVSLLRDLVSHQDDLGDEHGRIYLNLGIGEARLGNWREAIRAWATIQPKEAEYTKAQELLKAFNQDEAPSHSP